VVLVPKPDGMMRFCVDYRQINEVAVRDVYPWPRMDDFIDFLEDTQVSSTIDSADFDYVVQTRPGVSPHAVDTIRGSQHPRETTWRYPTRYPVWLCSTRRPRGSFHRRLKGGLLSPLTFSELLEGQAKD